MKLAVQMIHFVVGIVLKDFGGRQIFPDVGSDGSRFGYAGAVKCVVLCNAAHLPFLDDEGQAAVISSPFFCGNNYGPIGDGMDKSFDEGFGGHFSDVWQHHCKELFPHHCIVRGEC